MENLESSTEAKKKESQPFFLTANQIVTLFVNIGGLIAILVGLYKTKDEIKGLALKNQDQTYQTEQHLQEMFFKLYDKYVEVINSKSDDDKISFFYVVKALSLQSRSIDSAQNHYSVYLGMISTDHRFPDAVRNDAKSNLTQISDDTSLPRMVRVNASAYVTPQDTPSRSISQNNAPTSTPDKSNLVNVDIFYLNKGEESDRLLEKKAEDIADELSEKKYSVRVRPLFAEINNRPGYGVQQNQLRYNPSDPNEVIIKNDIRSLLPKNIKIDDKIVSMKTPWYVSIFIVE